MKNQTNEFLGFEVMNQSTQVVDDNEDSPIILQTQEGKKNPSHQPFFMSLVVSDLSLLLKDILKSLGFSWIFLSFSLMLFLLEGHLEEK